MQNLVTLLSMDLWRRQREGHAHIGFLSIFFQFLTISITIGPKFEKNEEDCDRLRTIAKFSYFIINGSMAGEK